MRQEYTACTAEASSGGGVVGEWGEGCIAGQNGEIVLGLRYVRAFGVYGGGGGGIVTAWEAGRPREVML